MILHIILALLMALAPIILILVAAIALAVTLSGRSRAQAGLDAGGRDVQGDNTAAARRTLAYIAAFAGLLATLYAVAGLLAVAAITVTLRSSTLLGTDDLRTRISFYLAALIVGLPLWLGGWLSAERRARRVPDERDASERRLFLAAVFATASVAALFGLHDVLNALLAWPGPADARPSLPDTIAAGVRLLVYGGVWLAYARIGWRERSPRAADDWHDLSVYILSGFALSFLVIGLNDGLRQVIGTLASGSTAALLVAPAASIWTVWGAIAAWIIAGGATWVAVWQYDQARGGQRRLRVFYLYLVVLVAAPTALAGGSDTLFELLRRLFGYQPAEGSWAFLRDALPPLVLGSLFWAYHWRVLRRQVAPYRAAAPDATGAIAWPRRPAVVLLALAGIAMVAPALISILWLGVDFTLNSGAALSGPGWWRDQLSLSVAAGIVGAAAWLGAWAHMQRAATAVPAHERTASERRLFLGGVTLLAGLTMLGFIVAALWLALRAILGDTLDTTTVGTAIKDVSTALVLALLAVYHGLILRGDMRFGPTHRARIRLAALLAPGAEDALASLRQNGRRIDVVGYLAPDSAELRLDLAALGVMLDELESQDIAPYDSALLVVQPDGGHLHLYARHAIQQAPVRHGAAPTPGRPMDATMGEAMGPAGA